MKRVLVTGLIGSGKSELCRYFSSLGFPVYECDSRMKALYREVPGLLEKCEKALEVTYDSFASVIFSNPAKLELLESIAFPALVEDMEKWVNSQSSELVFIESATAASKPWFDRMYDCIVLVRCGLSERIARNPKASERNSCQREPERVDYIIENSSDIASLRQKADELIKEIR